MPAFFLLNIVKEPGFPDRDYRGLEKHGLRWRTLEHCKNFDISQAQFTGVGRRFGARLPHQRDQRFMIAVAAVGAGQDGLRVKPYKNLTGARVR